MKNRKENNKLIARFMHNSLEDSYPDIEEAMMEYYEATYYYTTRYDQSWDWLMPVIKKILETVVDDDDFITEDYYIIIDQIPDLEQTYEGVVNFVKMFNETKDHKELKSAINKEVE